MALEEIDLTMSSDDEDDDSAHVNGSAAQLRQPQLVTPVKREREGTRENPSEDEGSEAEGVGLKPAITGGKGLWNLWTRNFKSRLLMLLDLVDNSVDAAMPPRGKGGKYHGRVQVFRDLYEVMPESSYTTGLCIRNNAPTEITPLKDVLKLFISPKENSGTTSIGENGVGLKQSCAALSDLSFVLVKNQEKLELGILAKALQRDDGCYLPCFEFKQDSRTVAQQMMDMFSKPIYKDVKECIAEYGKISETGNPSLGRGVARLSKHFDDINNKFFGCPNVFQVIIDKIWQHDPSEAGMKLAPEKNAAITNIINELQHEVPRRYLHIPEDFKFSVGKKDLSFTYWPERLVEFSKIEIPVRSKKPWNDDEWGEETLPDLYHLHLYLGFDRFRIINPGESGSIKSKKTCSFYVYSRESGRLIEYQPDSRLTLGLNFGGTEFCQALTVIIDDRDGHLPLDPTKQNVAFGNSPYGKVHQENLYAVVSGVVKYYYRYHLNKYGGTKAVLTEMISKFSDREIPENLKTCGSLHLTDYGLHFTLREDGRILVDHTCVEDEIVGPDTIFRLLPKKPQKSVGKKSSPSPPARKKGAGKAKESPAKKKQQPTGKARASPAKKKTQQAPRSPAKRKQPASKNNKLPEKKKQRPSKAKQLPPKLKGVRSSPRNRRTTTRSYSDSLNYGDESDGDENEGTIKVEGGETEANSDASKIDGLIDLCSSSDEEEEEAASEDDSDSSAKESQKKTADPTLPEGEAEAFTPCPKIGPGWTQKVVRRKNGHRDHYYQYDGKIFRSMAEVKRFLNSNFYKRSKEKVVAPAARRRSKSPVNSVHDETNDGKLSDCTHSSDMQNEPDISLNDIANDNISLFSDINNDVLGESSVLRMENTKTNNDAQSESSGLKPAARKRADSAMGTGPKPQDGVYNDEPNDSEPDCIDTSDAQDDCLGLRKENLELKARVAKLEPENTDLKARVSDLQTENDSLQREIKLLKDELEQKNRMISVFKRRANVDQSESEEV